MQNIFTRKAPVANCKDVFAICDLPGFAALAESVPDDNGARHCCRAGRKWSGNKEYNTSLAQVRAGDLSGVAASDALLDKIEAESFLSPVWRTRLDVVGGVPNVPAYIAGQPLNMRRRERVLSEQGPLQVFASMELSADIEVDTMRKRGAAVLALVRLLSNARPVELWTCCSGGAQGYASHVLVRLDTAPLDLARVAHVLTCPSVTRGLGYAVLSHTAKLQLDKTWNGHWGYDDHVAYRRTARENFATAVSPATESVLIPAAHVNDPCVANHVAWLKDMLATYGGAMTEAA